VKSQTFLLFGVVLAVALLVRRGPRVKTDRAARLLSSMGAPCVLGAVTSLIVWWIWGSLDPPPIFHDEQAYLLQARLFAEGRWTGPGRPLPEFFEQLHVFVTPRLAAKYPPGNSLLLVPGIWLGIPFVIPLLLTGVAGAFLFALGRRIAGVWVALLTWVVWITARGNLQFRPSYLSEVATSAFWLVGWWALLKWRDTGRRRWLLTLAAVISGGLLIRPFTTLAFAIPVCVVVLRLAAVRRCWRDVGLAAALGAMILGLIPIWSRVTAGDWVTPPYALYSRTYFPYERPGFGLDRTPPLRILPPAMQRLDGHFREMHRKHTVEALPGTCWERLLGLARDFWSGWRFPLLLFAVAGLFALPAEGWFALASSALLFLGHLFYAQPPGWTLYYLEALPALAFATAHGLWRALFFFAEPVKDAAGESGWSRSPRTALAALLLCLAAVGPSLTEIERARWAKREWSAPHRAFRQAIRAISEERSIVFVRPGSDQNMFVSPIANEPDLGRARVWIVHDRGLENVRLMLRATDRAPYLYDESRRALIPLRRAGGGAVDSQEKQSDWLGS